MRDSKIEWTHHTFNPWWGCEKVSPGCTHCYAESLSKRYGRATWGKNGTRPVASDAYWKQPLRWNAAAEKAGERHRVFCASMADVFEDRPDLIEPRARLAYLIGRTPHLDWLLLTKRPENVARLWVTEVVPPNVWLGTTVEDQERADERIPHLLATPAAVRFLSVEPLLGPVNLRLGRDTLDRWSAAPPVDWVIVGGESGPGARECYVDWIRNVRTQCAEASVPCFVKQVGAKPIERNDSIQDVWPGADTDDLIADDDYNPRYQGEPVRLRLRDPKGGDWSEWPASLRVREFPRCPAPSAKGRGE